MKVIINGYNTACVEPSVSYNCKVRAPHYGWTLGMISPWGNSSISA